jgi:hypothetical protein
MKDDNIIWKGSSIFQGSNLFRRATQKTPFLKSEFFKLIVVFMKDDNIIWRVV